MALSIKISSTHDVEYDSSCPGLSNKRVFSSGEAPPPNTAFTIQICNRHEIIYEAGASNLKEMNTIITRGAPPGSVDFPFQISSRHEINYGPSFLKAEYMSAAVTSGASPTPTVPTPTESPPTEYKHPSSQEPSALSLKDKVVLITGGASGLGAAITKEVAEHGAYVTIADLNEEMGKTYAAELGSKGLKINFVHTDVTSWSSQIAAFRSAIAFGSSGSKVDIVVASAGLWGTPFLHPNDELASLDKDPPAPPMGPINVNLIGLSYTAKLAQHYFSLPTSGSKSSKALILIGSSGGYLEIPLATAYNASKWGVRGLFRTIREPLAAEGIRVNLIAPWLMDTPMSRADSPAFQAVDLPVGKPAVVVKAVIRCAVDESISGRAFVVGPRNTMDLADDEDGHDGVLVIKKFMRNELPGYKEKIAKLMEIFGF